MPFDHPLPRPLTKVSVQTYAPAMSGLYGISNSREWVYIGETDNIQQALLSHLAGAPVKPGKAQPAGFVYEICDRSLRPARQDRLVLEYEPTGNRRSGREL